MKMKFYNLYSTKVRLKVKDENGKAIGTDIYIPLR